MVRDIVVYPDKRLKQISKEVVNFDEKLHRLLDDMYDTMVAKNGVGLAAIQIDIPLRVLIINIPIESESDDPALQQPRENTLEVINPVLLEADGKTKYQEGCLSIPGYFEDVQRYSRVKVEYQDRYGEKFIIEDDAFLAIALQHEMDHLEGRLFIEKLSIIKRKKFEKEWKKRRRSGS